MEDATFKFSNLSKFKEIVHGVSQRSHGDMRFGKLPDKEVVKNRQHLFADLGININQVIFARLSHGSRIVMLGKEEAGRGSQNRESAIPVTDGLMTSARGIFLIITEADCLPLMIYDPILQMVGIVHAGWRGIIDGIVGKAVEKFKNCGSEAENLVIGIGPGICQKHFVVKKDVLAKFKDLYPLATFIRNHDGYADLKKAVEIDFKKAGIIKTNLEISTDCPSCQNGLYGSFRKEGKFVPASAAVIGMR